MANPVLVVGFQQPQNWEIETANVAGLAFVRGIDALPGVSSEEIYCPFESTLHLAKEFDEKAVAKKFAVSAGAGTPQKAEQCHVRCNV